MNLRQEMAQRAKATAELGLVSEENRPISGWIVTSDDWPETTQLAVGQLLTFTNALLEMVLRLAEAVDELRGPLDVEGDEDP